MEFLQDNFVYIMAYSDMGVFLNRKTIWGIDFHFYVLENRMGIARSPLTRTIDLYHHEQDHPMLHNLMAGGQHGI